MTRQVIYFLQKILGELRLDVVRSSSQLSDIFSGLKIKDAEFLNLREKISTGISNILSEIRVMESLLEEGFGKPKNRLQIPQPRAIVISRREVMPNTILPDEIPSEEVARILEEEKRKRSYYYQPELTLDIPYYNPMDKFPEDYTPVVEERGSWEIQL